ncbi:DNA recombination protein RmuC [Ectothiorhodosinus mongolicus]|nr:DNA recombination protein RmuC [Ectothiorhodosinus mongolicus]ULX57721.1 DNA recombination protein RmuC [Ectothiorhodosinus mongolicus]
MSGEMLLLAAAMLVLGLSLGMLLVYWQLQRRMRDQFAQMATEVLKDSRQEARSEQEQRQQAIQSLLDPIKQALEKTEQQVSAMEKARSEAFGGLNEQIRQMAQDHQRLQQETNKLVQALSRPTVRGQWGQLSLRRLAELAGLVEHCDFSEEVSINTEDGRLRPDMIVRLPNERMLIVDVKTPMDSFLAAMDATSKEAREDALLRHARKLRERVKELAGKAYWAQFEQAPDFVILFVPGDNLLSSALEKDPDLLEYALSQRVILATPASLVALMRAVAYGWRQEALTRNAEQIRELGQQLHQRLATFTEHLTRLGSHIGSTVTHYNKAVGSLESQVMPSARRFTELGVPETKPLERPASVDHTPRS